METGSIFYVIISKLRLLKDRKKRAIKINFKDQSEKYPGAIFAEWKMGISSGIKSIFPQMY